MYRKPGFRSEDNVWTEEEVMELGLAGEEEYCDMDINMSPPDNILPLSPTTKQNDEQDLSSPSNYTPANEITKSGRMRKKTAKFMEMEEVDKPEKKCVIKKSDAVKSSVKKTKIIPRTTMDISDLSLEHYPPTADDGFNPLIVDVTSCNVDSEPDRGPLKLKFSLGSGGDPSKSSIVAVAEPKSAKKKNKKLKREEPISGATLETSGESSGIIYHQVTPHHDGTLKLRLALASNTDNAAKQDPGLDAVEQSAKVKKPSKKRRKTDSPGSSMKQENYVGPDAVGVEGMGGSTSLQPLFTIPMVNTTARYAANTTAQYAANTAAQYAANTAAQYAANTAAQYAANPTAQYAANTAAQYAANTAAQYVANPTAQYAAIKAEPENATSLTPSKHKSKKSQSPKLQQFSTTIEESRASQFQGALAPINRSVLSRPDKRKVFEKPKLGRPRRPPNMKKGVEKPKKKRQKGYTAYMLWCSTERVKVVALNPGIDFSTISKRLGDMWQTVPEKEKMTWRRKARRLAKKGSSLISTGNQHLYRDGSGDGGRMSYATKMFKNRTGDDSLHHSIREPGTSSLDVAAHLKLLGESLSIIGTRLQEHRGHIAVQGTLSVLLDSLLCALGPIMCLTTQVPQINGCPEHVLMNTLDNIAYIMPGVG